MSSGSIQIGMIMSTAFPPREGIGFYVWNLAQQLRRRGHEVQIITRGCARASYREIADGITVWRAAYAPTFPWHVHLHGLFVDRLVKRLETQVDVFHLHSPLVRMPRTHRPTLLTIHSLMQAASASFKLDSLFSVLTKLQTPVSRTLEHEALQRADYISCVSQASANELLAAGIKSDKIGVFANGVDASIFYPAPGPPLPGRYALAVGRLSPGKGLEDLLVSVEFVIRHYPQLRCLIAGEGPLRSKLKAEIDRRGLGANITLVGQISDRTELAALYRGAALYIHPSHYEGLPTALLEAMACGCPSIATDVGSVSSVLHNNLNGLLVEPRQPTQLAAAMLRMLDRPELADRLGHQAASTVAAQYTWSTLGQKYLDCYQALVSGAA